MKEAEAICIAGCFGVLLIDLLNRIANMKTINRRAILTWHILRGTCKEIF